MMLSLFVALTITPYLGFHLLKSKRRKEHKEEQGLETAKFINSTKNRTTTFR